MKRTAAAVSGNSVNGLRIALKSCKLEKIVAASRSWPVKEYVTKVRMAARMGTKAMMAVMTPRSRAFARSGHRETYEWSRDEPVGGHS